MPFNTRNPIPSGDLRDLDDNARNIDTWANDKTKLSHPDRFGVDRRTWHGIEQEAQLNIQQAIDAKNAAQEAAMMSGFSKYADTLAQLEAGIGTDYIDGDVVMVFEDESRGDTSSIFKIESGAAEFKLTFDKTRQDLMSFTGNISADAQWSDVPAHSDPAFDVQAQALANRAQMLKDSRTASPIWFGAKGDGVTLDDAVFDAFELAVIGEEVDLGGKTYALKKAYYGNDYRNGFFKIDGVLHCAEFKPSEVSRKRYCMEFFTGDNRIPGQVEIFPGARNTFQSICIVPTEDGLHLFVTQRSQWDAGSGKVNHGNFLKGEVYRIVEYKFSEDGAVSQPIAFSENLEIGHASNLGYRYEGTRLWLYSGTINDSETDPDLGGKGFSRIEWKGSSTSQADVTHYTMFDQPSVVDGTYPEIKRCNVNVSSSGKYIALVGDWAEQGFKALIYPLDSVLVASDIKALKPVAEFNFSISSGTTLQGIAVTDKQLIVYLDYDRDGAAMRIYDWTGSLDREIFGISLAESLYTLPEWQGVSGDIPALTECEGVCEFAGDLYVAYREVWVAQQNVVTYNGDYYAPCVASVAGEFPSASKNWRRVNPDSGAVAFDMGATYTTDMTPTRSKKRVFKLSSLDHEGSAAIVTGNKTNATVMKSQPMFIPAGSGYTWRQWLPNIGAHREIFGVAATSGNFYWFDYAANADSEGGFAAVLSPRNRVRANGTRDQFVQLRASTETNSANITLRGSLDRQTAGSVELNPLGASAQFSVRPTHTESQINTTGDIWRGKRGATTYPAIYSSTSNAIYGVRNGAGAWLACYSSDDNSVMTAGVRVDPANVTFKPVANNTHNLGDADARWKEVFSANGTINTSDGRLKTTPEEISDSLLDAWGSVRISAWKWLESVATKGDEARVFTGPIAQEIRDALVAHGVMEEGSTSCPWAGLCYNAWDAKPPVINEHGVTEEQGVDAGDMWSIRSDQCLFLEAAYQRRRAERIEARLAQIEAAIGLDGL